MRKKNQYRGVTCENQRTADERIPLLLQIPAVKRFVSFEPLLEEIDVDEVFGNISNLFYCDKCQTISRREDITHFWCPDCEEMRSMNDTFDDGGIEICTHCKTFEVLYGESECCPKCNESEPYAFGTIGTRGKDRWDSFIDQIIIGAEFGPRRRPCKLEWVESLIDQADAAGVKVFVKQLSINGKVSYNPKEWPERFRRRELI